MREYRITVGKTEIVWSYVATILSMASNFFMLPFLILFLDEKRLGLWYIFSSIGSISTLFDFGFSITFARNITYCWSGARALREEDVEYTNGRVTNYVLMKQVITSCKLVYAVISVVVFGLLMTVGSLYIRSISKSVAGNDYGIAWIVYAIAITFNLYYAYYSSFLRGVGAIERANKNIVIARVSQIATMIVMLCVGMGLIGVCVSYFVYGFVFRGLCKRHFYAYRGLGENLRGVTNAIPMDEIIKMFMVVWHNAWRDGLISVALFLGNEANTIICSLYLSLQETAEFSIGAQIATAVATVAGVLYTVYQPAIQSAYIRREKSDLKRYMSVVVCSYIIIFVILVFGIELVGVPLINRIRPTVQLARTVVFGSCIYQFVLKYVMCSTSYFSCTNRIPYLKSFLLTALLCLLLSIIMARNIGIWGLITAQIVSQLVYNIWVWPRRMREDIGTSLWGLINQGTTNIRRVLK